MIESRENVRLFVYEQLQYSDNSLVVFNSESLRGRFREQGIRERKTSHQVNVSVWNPEGDFRLLKVSRERKKIGEVPIKKAEEKFFFR